MTLVLTDIKNRFSLRSISLYMRNNHALANHSKIKLAIISHDLAHERNEQLS